MSTPTPQDIAKAICCPSGCVRPNDCFSGRCRFVDGPAVEALDKMFAAALAAERSRWQAVINSAIEAIERGSMSAPILECLKATIAQPATAEREVMPNSTVSAREDESGPRFHDAPPQPAPSPAGAVEFELSLGVTANELLYQRCLAIAIDRPEKDAGVIGEPEMAALAHASRVRRLETELTRLRSAPPVTEEMVKAALRAYHGEGGPGLDLDAKEKQGLFTAVFLAMTAAARL